eukprot:8543124-Pyramimonas_sp.AAC.1
MVDSWRFAHGGDMAMLTGDIYTDGSGLSSIAWPGANRAGWGDCDDDRPGSTRDCVWTAC